MSGRSIRISEGDCAILVMEVKDGIQLEASNGKAVSVVVFKPRTSVIVGQAITELAAHPQAPRDPLPGSLAPDAWGIS